jgi:tetratricopeptide (TPR) repeat protein
VTGDHERDDDELEFLLRSIADLETEREDGNIDDDTYRLLHDDYTARAAALIRVRDEGAEQLADEAPPTSITRRVLTVGGIVAFAIVIAFGLARAIGQRQPGGTITGKQSSSPDQGQALAAAVAASPKSYRAHLNYARYLLQSGDGSGAVAQFFAAEKLDPKQAEPPTYIGWLSVLQARQTSDTSLRKTLLDLANQSLNHAMAVDPKYPDAYVFKGLILYRDEQKPAAAIPMLQKFLVLAPEDHPMRAQVLQVLSQAVAATPTTTP